MESQLLSTHVLQTKVTESLVMESQVKPISSSVRLVVEPQPHSSKMDIYPESPSRPDVEMSSVEVGEVSLEQGLSGEGQSPPRKVYINQKDDRKVKLKTPQSESDSGVEQMSAQGHDRESTDHGNLF